MGISFDSFDSKLDRLLSDKYSVKSDVPCECIETHTRLTVAYHFFPSARTVLDLSSRLSEGQCVFKHVIVSKRVSGRNVGYLYPDFRYAMLRKVWPPGVFSHLSGAIAAAAGVIVLEHLM